MKRAFFVVVKMPFWGVAVICVVFAFAVLGLVYKQSSAFYPNVEAMAWPVVGKIIVVDAGHGGFDPGAVGSSGILEKDINLAVSIRLADVLRQAGAIVVETRTTDVALGDSKSEDMRNRVQLAKNANSELFITVQANSIPQKQYRGAQIFYAKKSDSAKLLAENIQEELGGLLKNTTRKALPINDIYIVKNLDVPVIVAEIGFLSNMEEEALLKDKAYQNKIAWGIYMGIIEYYSSIDDEEQKCEDPKAD
ncbi:MAG: N-acetylmuramoyl-L-alanine amidase [Clostridia bacterium]|nr:N-acetylmuramoyl-L-alanine amidase [Clostridia bacterium]